MYVLIGGAGSIGLNLARQVVELGHKVAMIDLDPIACRYARERVGVMAFEGSAVSTDTLLEAGILRAGAIVAALRQDALNLALVTLARHYGVPRIVAGVRHPDFVEPLRLVGATHVISTVDIAVTTMVNAIEYPRVESMMHFERGQIEVLKLTLPDRGDAVGRTLAEIARDERFPAGSLIIGYQAHPREDLIVPNGNTVLEGGSTVLVVTKPGYIHRIVDFIEGCSG